MLKDLRYIAVAVVCCVAAAPVSAQTRANWSRVFVGVVQYPDWDDVQRENMPGATWGSGFAFGVDGAKSGVEFDVGLPRWHVRNDPPYVSEYGGPSYGYEQHGHVYESSHTERRRSVDLTVLHRSNIPINQRVTFTWLVGASYVLRPDEATSTIKEVLPGGQRVEVFTYRYPSSRDYPAATARLDLELRIGPRLSVVPRLRLTAFPSLLDDSGLSPRSLSGRPELAARWTF